MKSLFSIRVSSFLFHNPFKSFVFIFIVLCMVFFSGCSSEKKNPPSDTLSVVTSFYPLQFFLSELGGDKIQVKNLAGTTSPHSYQLTPQDIIALNSADLVVIQGVDFEPWAADMIPQLKQKKIPVLEVMNIFSSAELVKNNEEEHDHGEVNPHTWLHPLLAKETAQEMKKQLILLDSKNSQVYQKNFEVIAQKLNNLDASYVTSLQNCKRDDVIGSHEAFDYLANQYGFSIHSIAGLSPHDEPSAHVLATLKNIVKEKKLSFILTEENSVRKFSETLARETGLKALLINAMETRTFDPKKDYFDISHENLKSFVTALECQ